MFFFFSPGFLLPEVIIFNYFFYTHLRGFPCYFTLLARLKGAREYVNVSLWPKVWPGSDWKDRGSAPSVTGSRAPRSAVTPLAFNAGRTRDSVRTPPRIQCAGCARTRSMTNRMDAWETWLSRSSSSPSVAVVHDSVHARRILARRWILITGLCNYDTMRVREASDYIGTLYVQREGEELLERPLLERLLNALTARYAKDSRFRAPYPVRYM